jgi:hypothetical protein
VKERSGLDTLEGAGPVFDGVAAARMRRSRSARRGARTLAVAGEATVTKPRLLASTLIASALIASTSIASALIASALIVIT